MKSLIASSHYFAQSALLDWMHLKLNVRPSIRIKIASKKQGNLLKHWVRHKGFSCVLDDSNFLSISTNAYLARKVIITDRSPGNHTRALGHLLGYPSCCCKTASEYGDHGLDIWAQHWTAGHGRRSKYLDPRGYLDGRGTLCHIPCSNRCRKSWKMAERIALALTRTSLVSHRNYLWTHTLSFRVWMRNRIWPRLVHL